MLRGVLCRGRNQGQQMYSLDEGLIAISQGLTFLGIAQSLRVSCMLMHKEFYEKGDINGIE